MAQSHNQTAKEDSAGKNALVLTATASVTFKQLQQNKVITANSSSSVALTLPVASAAMEGMTRLILDRGSGALTVVVAAGYGGAGSGNDTATLAQGEGVVVHCDGTNWYAISHTTPN